MNVLGSANGAAAQAATNIPGGTGLPAGTVFSGVCWITQSIGQAVGAAAVGSCRVIVSWVPGVGGTPAQTVLEVNLVIGLGGAATESQQAESLSVPVSVYVGSSGTGSFQCAVVDAGTVSNQLWSVGINGVAQ